MKATATQHESSKARQARLGEGFAAQATQEGFEDIATAAYYKAEARSFAPGHELDDWLEAEAEFNSGKSK